MIKDKEWMSIEEAIALVMERTGCSRRAARRRLAKDIKDKRIKARRTEIENTSVLLSPEDAVKKFKDDPTSVFFTLTYFIERFDFSHEEVLSELRSGRLRARGTESALFNAEMTGSVNANEVEITAKDLLRWLTHPKTPPHLVAKFKYNTEHGHQ